MKGLQKKQKQSKSKAKAEQLDIYKDKDKDNKCPTKKTIEERRVLFKKEVFSFKDYTETMLIEFFEYWIESDKKNKMKYEKNKTWDTSLRLKRWYKNSQKFNNTQTHVNPF